MAATNWMLQSYVIDEEIIPDPANPLAMKKRLHGVVERYRRQDPADDSGTVGATSDTVTFYVGTEEQTASSASTSDWALVFKGIEVLAPETPMVKTRVIQRWEAWSDWATYVPA